MKFVLPFFIYVFFCSSVIARQEHLFYLPDKLSYVFWKCKDDICNIFLKRKDTKDVLILKKTPFPTIKVLDDNLIELFFSCGSPCNYTIFLNIKNDISKPFNFVVAVDAKRQIVVAATRTNQLVIYNIFDKQQRPIFTIEKNWSPTATLFSAIIEAKFVNNDLYIKYLNGVRFKEKMELIHGVIK